MRDWACVTDVRRMCDVCVHACRRLRLLWHPRTQVCRTSTNQAYSPAAMVALHSLTPDPCLVARSRCGIFHLTDQGLATVRDCEMTGFHEHPSGIRIYQACAHVDLVETKPKVVDLRR